MVRDLEGKACEEQLRSFGLFSPVWSQELDSVILMDSFQLSMFCISVIP